MKTSSPAKARYLWLFAPLILAITGVAFYLGHSYRTHAAPFEKVALNSWYENGHGGRYLLELAPGSTWAGHARTVGFVLSDSNCKPDVQGLSHCRNGISLPDGSRITVIDNHDMQRYRCLSPGDRLVIDPVDSHWIVGTLSKV